MKTPCITFGLTIMAVTIVPGCSESNQATSVGSPQSKKAAHTIVGTIRSNDHQTIPGATVVIAHELDGTIYCSGGTAVEPVERRAVDLPGVFVPKGLTVAKSQSNEKGEFSFDGLADGAYTLVAVHPERGCAIVPNIKPAASKVVITLNPPTMLEAKLDGFDFDPKWHYVNLEPDEPVANLAIELRMEQKDTTSIFSTSPIPAIRDWSLIVWGRNSSRSFTVPLVRRRVSSLNTGAINKLTIDLASGISIKGRVTDSAGHSLPDVAVLARPTGSPQSVQGAFTDADGRYTITGLDRGPHQLEAVRHQLRSEIGCGEGPYDVAATKSIQLPLADSADADIRIDALVPRLKANDLAPDFSGATVDGKTVNLSNYRGKIVLLDFWATWCRTCLADLKYIAALQKELAPQNNFAVISISLDKDPHAVSRFLERQKMPWPQIVLGPADRNPIARQYNVTSTPTTILIDRNGKVAAQHIPGESLRAEVMKLLK